MVGLFRSRLGIILVSAALLLALDAGRSIWTRLALAVPSSEYRPEAAQYADLTWPPGANLVKAHPWEPECSRSDARSATARTERETARRRRRCFRAPVTSRPEF